MTYQPERDGYGVARSSADTTATADDRPVVIEDDGTRRTADDVQPVVDERNDRIGDTRVIDDPRQDRTASDAPLVTEEPADDTHLDRRRGDVHRSAGDQLAEAETARVVGSDTAGADGRHARALDAEDAHVVLADDPRVVRGQRVDTVAMPMAPEAVVARERAAYGGVKWGSAFFGWLTAIGLAVILTGLVAGAGTALGLANDVSSADVVNEVANGNASTIGIAGAIAVLLIILVSYFAGGYVAGRMARFDGARQGFAVWLWSIVIAAVLGLVGLLAGDQYDVLGNLNAFPRFPVDANSLSTAGLVALVMAVVVSLLGAILGGLAGMGFHRKVDAAAFDPERVELPA